MKKLLLTSLAAAALSLASLSAQAATVTSNFDVTVTLGARCVANNSGATTLSFGAYDAISAGAATPGPTATLTFNCTRGLTAPVVSFDGVTTNPTYGVIAGLNYSVTAGTGTVVPGAAATAVSGGVGGPDVHSYVLTGSMPANQAGECVPSATAGGCNLLTKVTRTMTLTY